VATVDFEAYLAFDYDGGKPFDVNTLLGMEDEAGIEYAVVMPANNGPSPERQLHVQPDNLRLAQLIKGNRRCIGCATINPALGPDNVKKQYDIIDEYGFGGPKLMGVLHKYNIDDPIVDPIMAMARERGQVVSIHSGGTKNENVHPNRIANVAARFPEVPIIVDHMGYPDATEDAIRAAEEHPNLYLGTTILRFFREDPSQALPQAVADAVRRVGAERVVWGSNMPEYPHSALWCRQAIERLKLGAEAEALIFGENLTRLYKIS
jgi:predicted TIM-barrel fold metal-dependent hydrolase